MNKKTLLLAILIMLSLVLTACGSHNKPIELGNNASQYEESKIPSPTKNTTEETIGTKEKNKSEPMEQETLSVNFIKKTEAMYLLAGKGDTGIHLADFKDAKFYLDDKLSDLNHLKNGMSLEIIYSGNELRSYPGILVDVTEVKATSSTNNEYANIVNLYTQVFSDILKDDEGLNFDINYIGLDLVDAPGNLNQTEMNVIAYLLTEDEYIQKMDSSPTFLLGNYDDFVEQGYINDKDLYWEDGIILSIRKSESNGQDSKPSNQELMFDAVKWRSGDGAIFYNNCIAIKDDNGYWMDYEIGEFAIS